VREGDESDLAEQTIALVAERRRAAAVSLDG
jgi:hypothetical protein